MYEQKKLLLLQAFRPFIMTHVCVFFFQLLLKSNKTVNSFFLLQLFIIAMIQKTLHWMMLILAIAARFRVSSLLFIIFFDHVYL